MKKIYSFLFLLAIGFALNAQTTLNQGDIALIGIDTNDEEFAFVTFVELEPGTEIYFTDEEFGLIDDNTDEGTLLYSAPGTITAGSVIVRLPSSSDFSVTSDGDLALGNSGDGIIAYQGTVLGTVTTYLHGIGEDSGDIGSGATFPHVLLGSDNGEYTGTRLGQTAADYFNLINDNSNYNTSGGALSAFDTTSFDVPLGTIENGEIENNIKVYLNAAKELEVSGAEVAAIQVYDLNGRVVAKSNISRVSVVDLDDGVYIASIQDNDGNSFTKKFIKN